MKTRKILVVGSANIDLIARAPMCPRPGESLVGSSFMMAPGGKGANQAVACARLGADTTFVGSVGDDHFGEHLVETLVEAGVHTPHVKIQAGSPTGTALIIVADDGENSIVVTPAANSLLTTTDLEQAFSQRGPFDAVLVQLEIPLDVVEATLRLGREQGAVTMLDAGPARPITSEILRWADVVSPNALEAEAITGVKVVDAESGVRASEALHEMGAERVVLKCGGEGAIYWDEAQAFSVPPYPVTPVDTVGAGDAFTASLAYHWDEENPREAVSKANAAGALATTVAGAQPAMPSGDAVMNLSTGELFPS